MQGIFPVKASASVVTSQNTVSTSSSPPTPSSNTLTTPELDQSSLFSSPSSNGSVRKNKRPPPVKIPQYAHYSPPVPTVQDFSRQCIVSNDNEDIATEDEDIPIYFGGLPAHLSGRRPSIGIPLDATYDQSGFLSSRSSSFGNCLPSSPLPKLSIDSNRTESYHHPLEHLDDTADTTHIKGFYGPIDPFASSAPTTNKIQHLVAVTAPMEKIGLGLGLFSSRHRHATRDLTSISLDKGTGKAPRDIHPGGLSVPTSTPSSKLRKEIGRVGHHARSNSADSMFTVSAYEALPSDTPLQYSVSRFENQLGDDPVLLARHRMLLLEPVSPKSMAPEPSRVHDAASSRIDPVESSPFASTHAEAGFFLSQVDSYLAQHTESPHRFRNQPLKPSFGSHQEVPRASKPSLMLNTSCLLPAIQIRSAIESTDRKSNHMRDRSVTSQTFGAPLRRSIDQNTTIQLSIDQVEPVFKYTRTRSAKAFQARPNGRPHTAGSVRDTGKQPFADTGCIEFRMEKKDLWPYHYSALEPLPTLRKIWVNGDTRHNQIRRTASLGLRSNGVYQIYGTREKGDVEWKFEYVVEDRRSEATGKVISGERIVMPLTFSCTPDFLDGSQAVRIGLVNKVRRTVTPPVNAHRVPPPSLSATSSDQSTSQQGRKTPLFSFSRTDSSHSTDQASPNKRDSPRDVTRPLRSKISASLLPFSGRTKRPSTAQPRVPCSSPLSPLATSVSVGALGHGQRLEPSRTRDSICPMSAGTSFISLDTETKPLLPSQRSPGFLARWTPKSILKKRPATAARHP